MDSQNDSQNNQLNELRNRLQAQLDNNQQQANETAYLNAQLSELQNQLQNSQAQEQAVESDQHGSSSSNPNISSVINVRQMSELRQHVNQVTEQLRTSMLDISDRQRRSMSERINTLRDSIRDLRRASQLTLTNSSNSSIVS